MQKLDSGPDIMAALRAGTAEQHQSIEKQMPFFRKDFSIEDYRRLVGAFLGFFEPVEERLAQIEDWEDIGLDFAHRRRSHLLRADLLALGYSPDSIAALPRCTRLPPLNNRFHGLGCMYVLEGSTLGGQIIARELARRFNIAASSGVSFFLSHGPSTGEMWKQFCSAVRVAAHGPIHQQAAVKTARETFTNFETWMQEVL